MRSMLNCPASIDRQYGHFGEIRQPKHWLDRTQHRAAPLRHPITGDADWIPRERLAWPELSAETATSPCLFGAAGSRVAVPACQWRPTFDGLPRGGPMA